MRSLYVFFCLFPLLAVAVPPDTSQLPPGAKIGRYVGNDVMIPMRDGTHLHAQVWRPDDVTTKLPILLQRSPYGFGMQKVQEDFAQQYKELAREGFIFVLEDIRGRFGSEGEFVMLRPQATTPEGIDESTDAYDTIDWLVKSISGNNGKVGAFGVSYVAWTTAMAVIHPHAALKAVSVQASPEDMYLGDDFHHNGAFRLDYAWEYASALETDGRTLQPFSFGADDSYGWFLKQGGLAQLDQKALGRALPSWQNFVAHPDYDTFWRVAVTSSLLPHAVAVPNLLVAGWWDQEDFYGPLTIYKRQQRGDPGQRNFLVIGPWNHGGWARGDGRRYGPYDLGADTSVYFREQAEVPWFKHWLKGEGELEQPHAMVFETGSNEWHSYEQWPPHTGVSQKRLYLHAKGALGFDPPAGGEEASDSFVSDPSNPVPYRQRPISAVTQEDSTWPTWMADDQGPLARRADVLTFITSPLDRDVAIRGNVVAKLFASTTGSDADWIVKLVDVYPGDESVPKEVRGRELMVANDVFRGRYLHSFEKPQPLIPGQVDSYSIDLHSASHVFKKGHRIAVHVQSSWFPLIDRNPQVFQPSIFMTDPSAFKSQTHRVMHSGKYPSALIVDVVVPSEAR